MIRRPSVPVAHGWSWWSLSSWKGSTADVDLAYFAGRPSLELQECKERIDTARSEHDFRMNTLEGSCRAEGRYDFFATRCTLPDGAQKELHHIVADHRVVIGRLGVLRPEFT